MFRIIILASFLIQQTSAFAASEETELVELSKIPAWASEVQIAEDGMPEWRRDQYVLLIGEHKRGTNIYVPYDLTDAWRELDAILPLDYANEFAHQPGAICDFDDENERLWRVHAKLIYYLSHFWLSTDESRLDQFLSVILKSSNQRDRKKKQELKAVYIETILCGYYSLKRNEEYPSLAELVKFFREAINN